MLCKQDAGGTPSAAVAWVEGGSPLEPVAGRALELMDLVQRGQRDVVQALWSLLDVMRPWLNTKTGKRRCHADDIHVIRALVQLRPDRVPAPNALLREVLPVVSQAKVLDASAWTRMSSTARGLTPPTGSP